MKKIILAMTAMLSASAAFVSCSDKNLYDESAVENAKIQQTQTKYKEAFVKHFGNVDPDQNWDFSQVNYPETEQTTTATRAWSSSQLPAPVWKEPDVFTSFFHALVGDTYYPNADADFETVKTLVESQPVVDWPYQYAQVNLHPFYSHGTSVLNYYFLGVQYNQKTRRGIIYPEFNGFCFLSMGNKWSKITDGFQLFTYMNMNSYATVNTTNMQGVDGFKWFVASRDTEYFSSINNANPLEKCKMFYVNGHTYVALDCNGDGIYSDLICWVEDCSPAKRYMVEDLGGIGDFDFNDIVFDVVYNESKKKFQCVVRAMGGTLDFNLKVGSTEWSKSGAQYNIEEMYNTIDPDYTSTEYARFDVDNWQPELNDVTVTVKGNDGVFVLPFPKDGEIPYMIATNIVKPWSKERVNVNSLGWFGSTSNDGKIEVKE